MRNLQLNHRSWLRLRKLTDPKEIWRELSGSWENIFWLEGRKLRNFMGIPEKKDVQAVFPLIMKEWIVETDLRP